jgi:hypothetical protein
MLGMKDTLSFTNLSFAGQLKTGSMSKKRMQKKGVPSLASKINQNLGFRRYKCLFLYDAHAMSNQFQKA